MGHFIPMTHLADALMEAGHTVFFVSNEDSYNDHKGSKILTAIGCENQIFTKDGIDRKAFFKKPEKFMENPQEEFFEHWSGFAIEEIKKIKPDIIVCDFVSRAGILAADEMGIPCVINIPGLLEFVNNFGMSRLISHK